MFGTTKKTSAEPEVTPSPPKATPTQPKVAAKPSRGSLSGGGGLFDDGEGEGDDDDIFSFQPKKKYVFWSVCKLAYNNSFDLVKLT